MNETQNIRLKKVKLFYVGAAQKSYHSHKGGFSHGHENGLF